MLEQQLKDLLKKLAPKTSAAKRDRFVPYLLEAMPRYGIDSDKRIAAFLATCCFESDYFKATEEYADGWAYDKSRNPRKAKELGNTEKGDGPKFKGRGLIQLTGRANYSDFDDYLDDLIIAGNKLLGDGSIPFLVQNPQALGQPRLAVESACWYWQTHKLNPYADIHDFFAIQGVVNRGNPTKKAKDYTSRESLYLTAQTFLNSLTPATSTADKNPALQDGAAPTPEPSILINNDVDNGKPIVGWLSNGVTWLQSLTDRSASIETSVSKSSWATKILGWIFAVILSGLGVIKDNPWETIIGGAIVIAVIWYWHHAKERENQRKLSQSRLVEIDGMRQITEALSK